VRFAELHDVPRRRALVAAAQTPYACTHKPAVFWPALSCARSEVLAACGAGSAQERDGALCGELVEADRQGVVVLCDLAVRTCVHSSALAEPGLSSFLHRGTTVIRVQFHEVHGLSLIARDMDPSFAIANSSFVRGRTVQ
jgi:hypothetical protein